MTGQLLRPVPGFRLAATAEGRVQGPSGRWLSPFPDKDGYLRINAFAPHRVQVGVHRVVCLAYHGVQPEQAQVVRHLDGNILNNRAANLCWGTYAENEADKIAHGTANLGERNPAATLLEADVLEIRRLLAQGTAGCTLARRYGVSDTTISEIKHGRTWRHLWLSN